ncbi:MAG: TauD/TfdA family dioxygenase [Ectothiorhodospiraceae bacterium AqS1]|nr:TauD/TfdA family dioxygenase [Ectothiorhodospiraceae bacterium AqS1]
MNIADLSIAKKVSEKGFLFFPSLCPSIPPEEAIGSLGSLLTLGKGPAVHYLTPKSKHDEPPNTYSGNFGLDIFPFHTGLAHHRHPPRYVILRCIKGYPSVKKIGENSAKRALVRSRRYVNGEILLLTLYEETEIGHRFRWDKLFLQPASPQGTKVFDQVLEQIERQKTIELSLIESGDTLIIDNWRMLHSRSSVPDLASDRKIARAYSEYLT